jgi:hypothetical protein
MGVAYNPRIVTNGLVLALDAGNTKSYPGSGTTWTDLSSSNSGTLVNDPTFSDNTFIFDSNIFRYSNISAELLLVVLLEVSVSVK